jgi:hypothetical protein
MLPGSFVCDVEGALRPRLLRFLRLWLELLERLREQAAVPYIEESS